jgi:acetyltransferase-like isoleucine patch superfamily enzyme
MQETGIVFMKKLALKLRSWWNGIKLDKKGRRCRFMGKEFVVEGHVEVGDYCRFRDHVILRTHKNGKIVFGNHSGCSYFVVMEAEQLIQIGNDTAITEFCVIRDTNHMVYGTDVHWDYTPHITKPVIIGSGVLVGSRTYIHPGVTIGDGAIIGAGSLLKEDTQVGPYEIWAGAPARRVAHRTEGVPEVKLKEAQELIAQQGLRKGRYEGKF